MSQQIMYLGRSSRPNSIGGSCYLLDIEVKEKKYRVMIDCGPEIRTDDEDEDIGNEPNFSFVESDDKLIDAVFLTHAHTDHVGSVAILVRKNLLSLEARIWASPQTCAILPYVLEDGLKQKPKYNAFDIGNIIQRLEVVLKPGEIEILPGLKVFVFQNGHLPGGFGIIIAGGLFTSDFCLNDLPVTKGLVLPSKADWPLEYRMVGSVYGCDATYDGGPRPSLESETQRLIDSVQDIVLNHGGIALLAAFGAGRTQSLAAVLSKQFASTGMPIYIDGLGRAIYQIFQDNRWTDQDTMLPRIGEKSGIYLVEDKQRQDIIESHDPKIIITTGGMFQFGPIMAYACTVLEDPRSGFFFSSWLAPGTNGVRLVEKYKNAIKAGQKNFTFHIKTRDRNGHKNTEPVNVQARVDQFGMSGHGGPDDSLALFNDIIACRNGQIFDRIVVTHGTNESKKKAINRFSHLAHELIIGECGTRLRIC